MIFCSFACLAPYISPTVTSGTFSPSLKKPVAMGYINVPHHKNGTEVMIDKGRGKLQAAKVTKMPFVPSNYKR